MPISLSELKERRATVDVYREIQHTGMKPGDLKVQYNVIAANTLTDEMALQEALYAENTEAFRQEYVAAMLRVVVGWDLSETPDGPPVPITEETLAILPADLLRDTLDAIQKHKRPGEARGRR